MPLGRRFCLARSLTVGQDRRRISATFVRQNFIPTARPKGDALFR